MTGDRGDVTHIEEAGARKSRLRAELLAARRALSAETRAASAEALREHVLALAADVGEIVCAYLPIGSEPGSTALLDALRDAGHRVLLPVVPAVPGPLDWAEHTGPDGIGAGPLGLREPLGRRLGTEVIASASLVLVPGLAADRTGVRLGRGGGYYDRTLPAARPLTPLAVLLHEGELIDDLPADAYDVRVTAAVLPVRGTVPLGNNH
ncbi:MAG: 5-formyltetrahydrofolate cyclo-ligase [Pseudonocardia sp.]|nr:5-formyltetrahydrofolate cyclo-ligase [Pseudonocardia sp.]